MIDCTKPFLPPCLELRAKRVVIMMKKCPYVIHKNGNDEIHVSDGLIKVEDPGDSTIYEEGMIFKLKRQDIVAEKIKRHDIKYRGSKNHHKFLVTVYNAKIQLKCHNKSPTIENC